MSNAGQAGSAIVGGIIGFVVTGFNPVGALYGAQIGLLIGTAIFPTQLPGQFGPRIEDLATTQAQLGSPIPIIYGTIAVPGVVMFLSCVEEVATTEEVGGKGAPESEVTTYTYYQSIALGLCEGPIDGVSRIWENGELKYDMRPQQPDETLEGYAERIEASSEYGAGFSLYLGDEFQEADPTLELTMGVGEVPAFRGLCYIVYPNRQLRDEQARRHPQFKFEVYRGQSIQQILPPTTLSGALNGYQSNFLVPDWLRNRYYAIDLTGTEGIRQFDILTNTELQQRTFDEIITPPTPVMLFMGGTIGPDGALYFNWFTSGNHTTTFRLDPNTLEETSRITMSGFQGAWHRACVVRHFGTLETTDYLFWSSAFNWLCASHANPVFLPAIQLSHSNDDALVTNGYRQGTTSYAYALTFTSSLTSSPAMDVYLLTIDEEYPLGIPTPVETLEIIGSIPMTSLDPDCVRVIRVTGLMFDQTDRTLIFGASGQNSSGDYVVQGFYKYDPQTNQIVWRSAELQIANNNEHTHESRLRGGTYAISQGILHMAVIDTRTGSHTMLNLQTQVPNIFIGEELYDSGFGTYISFVFGQGPYVVFLNRRLPGSTSVASIVEDICTRCALQPAEIDVTALESRSVNGFAVTRPTPGRANIEALRPVAFFDGVESDGLLKFPTRGGPIVATLSDDDLGAHFAGEERPPLVTTSKMQDVELPKRVRLQYIAESRGYDNGNALSPTRVTSGAVNEIDMQVPVSITDDLAAQAADVGWSDAWGSRWSHQFTLDVSHLALDPCDVIGLPVDGRLYRARIVSIDDSAGLLRRLTVMRDDDGNYTSVALADPPQRPPMVLVAYSATALILLDLPPLRDEDDNAGLYAVAYPLSPARQWTGAVIHRSADSGSTFTQVAAVTSSGTVGRLASALPAGISSTWDFANVVEVDVMVGELESRTEAAVLNGANAAAIGGHGRWEIIQFQTAVQVSASRWQLSGLLRGRRGTEHNIGGSISGDLFVMLSTGSLARIPLQTSEIGASLVYRAVTFGTSAVDASTQVFTSTGEALRPFSPVHIEGEEQSGGDLLIYWTRRGRLGQELRDGADIPLSEESEEYEVDILDPSYPDAVLRTLETTSPSVTYTAADQATDGFGVGDPIMVRVYQISAVVGRGHYGVAVI